MSNDLSKNRSFLVWLTNTIYVFQFLRRVQKKIEISELVWEEFFMTMCLTFPFLIFILSSSLHIVFVSSSCHLFFILFLSLYLVIISSYCLCLFILSSFLHLVFSLYLIIISLYCLCLFILSSFLHLVFVSLSYHHHFILSLSLHLVIFSLSCFCLFILSSSLHLVFISSSPPTFFETTQHHKWKKGMLSI